MQQPQQRYIYIYIFFFYLYNTMYSTMYMDLGAAYGLFKYHLFTYHKNSLFTIDMHTHRRASLPDHRVWSFVGRGHNWRSRCPLQECRSFTSIKMVHTHTHTRTHPPTHPHTHPYTDTDTYTYTYTHTYHTCGQNTHTHTHTHTLDCDKC